MTKGFSYIVNLSKAAKPPKGFTPIPRGKKGGYRKRVGNSYEYWYPDTGVTSSPKLDGAPHSAVKEGGKRLQVDGAGKLPDGVRERIEKYNLDIVAEAGSDPQTALDIAARLEAGIDAAADICQSNPPICAGNMGIPRTDMPQIMDEPIKDMLNSDKDLDRIKAQAAIDAGADPNSDKSPFDLMLDSFRADGIAISEPTPMSVGELRATQSDIQAAKATGMAEAKLKDGGWSPDKNPIVISNDGHILDGHHRWAAMLMVGPESKMKTIKVDLPMAELLDRSFDVPGAGVFRMDLQNNVVEGGKPDYAEYKAKADNRLLEARKGNEGDNMSKSLKDARPDSLSKGAKGSQKAGHKYKSRKPDGKGGWLYDYGDGKGFGKERKGSGSAIDDIASAVEKNGLMGIKKPLEAMGYKVSGVQMGPNMDMIMMIEKDGKTFGATSKKNVEDPDMVVGNIAIGQIGGEKEAAPEKKEASSDEFKMISESEFDNNWEQEEPPSGEVYWTYDELKEANLLDSGRVWSVTIGDEGGTAAPGFSVVNNFGYIVTKKPHNDANMVAVLYEEDDFEDDDDFERAMKVGFSDLMKSYKSPLKKAEDDEEEEEEEEDDELTESEREMLEEEKALEKAEEPEEPEEDMGPKDAAAPMAEEPEEEPEDEDMDKGHGYKMDKGHDKVTKGFNYVWRQYKNNN